MYMEINPLIDLKVTVLVEQMMSRLIVALLVILLSQSIVAVPISNSSQTLSDVTPPLKENVLNSQNSQTYLTGLTVEVENVSPESVYPGTSNFTTRQMLLLNSTQESLKNSPTAALLPLSRNAETDYQIPDYDPRHNVLCSKVEQCEKLQYADCLGAPLPYTHTSLMITKLHSQRSSKSELEFWSESLRKLPRCWAVVQPYLCSVLFPPCDNETSLLHLPPKDLCDAIRVPCAIVTEGRGWPSFLSCDDEEKQHKQKSESLQLCSATNSLREVKFNSSSGSCVPPLVPTPRYDAWYPGIKGCALPCSDPHFDREETAGFRSFVGLMSGLSVACCAFNVLIYLLEWRCGGRLQHPSILLLYINGCFLVAGIASLVHFDADVREEIVCHSDGTLRTKEPSTEGNLSCVIVFVCLYYFGLAGSLWLTIMSYSWFCYCKDLKEDRGNKGGKGVAYYHLLAWSLPLVLTITTMAIGQVSANSLHGVCFLSPSLSVRVPLLLLPMVAIFSITTAFILKCVHMLWQWRLKAGGSGSGLVREYILRLCALLFSLTLCVVVTLFCHTHDHLFDQQWQAALRQSILCRVGLLQSIGGDECQPSTKPSLSIYKLQVLAWCLPAIVTASFCWTSNTSTIWRACVGGVVGTSPSLQETVPVNHHKISPEKVVRGQNAANDWVRGNQMALQAIPVGTRPREPQVVNDPLRRGYESDSDQSVDTRLSVESGVHYFSSKRQQRRGRRRRHSLDSQLSFHVSDVEREVARRTMIHFGGGQQRASVTSYNSRTSRVSRADWMGKRVTAKKGYDSRRASFTSEDSSFSSVVVTRTTEVAQDTLFSNMMRRLELSSSAESKPMALQQVASTSGVPHPLATIAVQTSLEAEDLRPFSPPTSEKGVQVSPSSASSSPHTLLTPSLHRKGEEKERRGEREEEGKDRRKGESKHKKKKRRKGAAKEKTLPISRNNSTDYLITSTGTPFTSTPPAPSGRLSSAYSGSRGTFLDTETISTMLDTANISDESC